jgi:hypothetical protein
MVVHVCVLQYWALFRCAACFSGPSAASGCERVQPFRFRLTRIVKHFQSLDAQGLPLLAMVSEVVQE